VRRILLSKLRNIPFSPPDITDEEVNEVINVMKSGWITTGARTKEFERRIAEYVGVNKAVCLSSATAAMELTLRILGIGPGDEVITTAYTYTASASVIDHVGAKIVLVDTAPDSFEMDYQKLTDAITENTKAIIPVDIAGKMCDYDKIYEVVESKKKLFKANNHIQELFNRVIIMADAAHAFGAERKGMKCGQVADFTTFSFHAVKNLTTAEGGAVVWRNDLGLDDDELYKQFMLYSLHGQSKDALAKSQKGAWEYDIIFPAYKCNMTDILAGFGLIQLKRYKGLLERRKEIIEKYDSMLNPLGVQSLHHFGENFSSAGHLYLARIPEISEVERNEIIIKMAEDGIATNVHYKPLPMFTAYKNLGFDIKNYPNAYRQYANEITLPLHTLLNDEDVEYICGSLRRAIDELLLNSEAAIAQWE
jgi:dTDP-4-amino-4,6-dideoxygalactose transaminase